ncbi:unnamed protein product [Didymodactylos carnosus]|uniref:G-protein coupled receptors family 1 profile domain-containing protein n=1 Tax=Didymodactylos carnosus TaxID=1234261 RepID=A0A8S2CVN7_9BILA|nr:unnamed protein product [Didymodactylos carnosus]CAF3530566.1 unnamed protein product [Didymodactylos carnosus]
MRDIRGVTGNILAIIVLTKRRMIMSSTNNYLMILALVDIFYLLLTMTLNVAAHPCFIHRSSSEIISTIARPIADWSSNASVWLTVTFTIERWVAITYPLQSRTWCTVYHARRIISGVLFAALIATLPSAFETKLVRVKNNQTNSYRIEAQHTSLLKSKLYQKFYFNFVTFAIIWIPLILLFIFNTILIVYVHRSKKSSQNSIDGIKLRRHHRTTQNEQRKTTIMLIAVVIVFTVCQIPQAISLTIASYNEELAISTKLLIYNNFANSLVALNASINFVLYCCFSDRFRSTFRSSFSFLNKCYNLYFPGAMKKNFYTNSFEQINTKDINSSFSLHSKTLGKITLPTSYSRSNMINDASTNPRYSTSVEQQQCQQKARMNGKYSLLSRLKSISNKQQKWKKSKHENESTESTESPLLSIVKNNTFLSPKQLAKPSNLLEKIFNSKNELNYIQICDNKKNFEPLRDRSTLKRVSKSFTHPTSNSNDELFRKRYYSNGHFKNRESEDNLQQPSLKLCPNTHNDTNSIYHSFSSLKSILSNENNDVWIKRLDLQHRSPSTSSNSHESLLWGEILDVQV